MRTRPVVLSVTALLFVGGLAFLFLPSPNRAAGVGESPPAPDDSPLPVLAAAAVLRDVPVLLKGLGTVQSLNTVRIGSRVDGHLLSVVFREGQEVRAGDLLAQVDPRPYQAVLRQAAANLQRDQAGLRSARSDLERMLAIGGYTSRQVIDNQRSKIEQLEATVDADHAQLESARLQLEYAAIRSPIDGRIGLRAVDEGNILRAGDATAIAVVTQIRPIAVVFTLAEDALTDVWYQLATGRTLTVTVYGRNATARLAEGTLLSIDNTVDRRTGTFRLKAVFSNDNGRLWPGEFVNAHLHLATRRDRVAVPETTVQFGPQGSYAYVIGRDGTVAMREVAAAPAQDGTAVIEHGLRPGERIVVEGQHRLRPGSRVVEVAPEAGPSSGRPPAQAAAP